MDLAAAEIFSILYHPQDRDWPDDNRLNRAIQRDFPSLAVARLLDDPGFLILRSIWVAKDRHLRRIADPEARAYAIEWFVGAGPLIDCYLEWMKDADGGLREAFVTMKDMIGSLARLLGLFQKPYGETGMSLKERLMNCVYGMDEDTGPLDNGTKIPDDNQYQSDSNCPRWSNEDGFIKEGQAGRIDKEISKASEVQVNRTLHLENPVTPVTLAWDQMDYDSQRCAPQVNGPVITTIPTQNETNTTFEDNLESPVTTAVPVWNGMRGSCIEPKRCTLNECSEAITMLACENLHSEATEPYCVPVSGQQTEAFDIQTIPLAFTQTGTVHPLCDSFLSVDDMASDVMIKGFDGPPVTPLCCFKGKWDQSFMCSPSQTHVDIDFSGSPQYPADLQSQSVDSTGLSPSYDGSYMNQAPTFLHHQDSLGTQPMHTQFDAQMNWIAAPLTSKPAHNQMDFTTGFAQPPFLQALPTSSAFELPSEHVAFHADRIDSSSPPPRLSQNSPEQQESNYRDAHDLKDIRLESVAKRTDGHVPRANQLLSLPSVRAKPRRQSRSGRARRSGTDQTTYQLPQITSVGPAVRRTNRTKTSYESWLDNYLTTVFFDLEGGILSKRLRRQVLAATGLHSRKLTYWFSNHRTRLQKALKMYQEAKKRWPENVYDYKSYKEWVGRHIKERDE